MRNRRIRMLAKSAALLTLCIAAASALAGCGGQDVSDRTERSSGAASGDPSGGTDRADSGPSAPAPQASREAGVSASHADGTGGADVEPTAASETADARQPYGTGWYADPPELLGIAIGASEEDARERHGEPADTYRLHDPPMAVLEYDGFAVGIGEDGRVRYVELSGEGLPSGIGDLAVGGTADEAAALLGEPDQASDTVLLYRRDGVSLKFDFDPNTKRIASILLFAEH